MKNIVKGVAALSLLLGSASVATASVSGPTMLAFSVNNPGSAVSSELPSAGVTAAFGDSSGGSDHGYSWCRNKDSFLETLKLLAGLGIGVGIGYAAFNSSSPA